MTDLPSGDDIDSTDWLANRFGAKSAADAESEPAAPAETPVLVNPLAAPPSAFVWGLKPRAAEPAEALPSEPAEVLSSAADIPVETSTFEASLPVGPVVEDPLRFAFEHPDDWDDEPRTVALPWAAQGPPAASVEVIAALDTADIDTADIDAAGLGTADSPSIDSLFGATEFRDYDAAPVAAAPTPEPTVPEQPVLAPATPQQVAQRKKAAVVAIGSLLAVATLAGLFAIGAKLPGLVAAPVAAVSKSPTPTPVATATPTAVPVAGPVSPGVHQWSELRGAECVNPFPTAWAEKFTVVDCATPHAAQLVSRAAFPAPAPSANDYPGIPALQAQINLLCGSPSVINFGAAGAYSDLQFQAAYAATAKEWASGYHDYFCFVSRSSGEAITASVAVAPAG